MTKWFIDDNFVKECRNQYLDDRRKYRLTGVKKHEPKKFGN